MARRRKGEVFMIASYVASFASSIAEFEFAASIAELLPVEPD